MREAEVGAGRFQDEPRSIAISPSGGCAASSASRERSAPSRPPPYAPAFRPRHRRRALCLCSQSGNDRSPKRRSRAIFAVRTPVPAERLDSAAAVAVCKSLGLRFAQDRRSRDPAGLSPSRPARGPRFFLHTDHREWHLAPTSRRCSMTTMTARLPAPGASAPSPRRRERATRRKAASGVPADSLRVHSLHSPHADFVSFTRNKLTTSAACDRTLILALPPTAPANGLRASISAVPVNQQPGPQY